MNYTFCPWCATHVEEAHRDGVLRLVCQSPECAYIHWDNPVPVVAAVVEHEGHIILARNRAWPVPFYALITGFLEKSDPSPEEAVAREVLEELGLRAQGVTFIGHYPFAKLNQIILAYHVPAVGCIALNEELVDYKRIAPDKARYWPAATGLALRDWLVSQGHQPQAQALPQL